MFVIVARKWALPDGFCSQQYTVMVKFAEAPCSFPSILFSIPDSNFNSPHVTDERELGDQRRMGKSSTRPGTLGVHRFKGLSLSSHCSKEVTEGAVPISGLFGKFCPAGNQNTDEISCPRWHNLPFPSHRLWSPSPSHTTPQLPSMGDTELVVCAG